MMRILSLAAACAWAAALTIGGAQTPGAPAVASSGHDVVADNRDLTVAPGKDFFTYANGGWLKAHPIPPSEPEWGIGSEVREDLFLTLRQINEEAARAHASAGSDQQKIGDFWTTAMDAAKADRLGIAPLRVELDRIDAVETANEAVSAALALQRLDVPALFRVSVEQDEKNSAEMSVHLTQSGLGLPERDFYFNPEAGTARIRTEYVAHMRRMMKLLGRDEPTAAKISADIMTFETALAQASRKLEDLRDPERNYNKMTVADVTLKETPSIHWRDRLADWGLRPSSVIVGQPEYLAAVDRLLETTPVPVLKDYLRFHLVSVYAPFLGKAIYDEYFSFYRTVLSGTREQLPRWKRVLYGEEMAMGMVVGRVFVKEYFPEAAKQRYRNVVDAIRTAYAERIARLDWMSDTTKARAQAKLSAITVKVGYPDHWKDYSALAIGTNSYAENMMNAARWRFNDMISKFGKPVDRTEWAMTPQTYNAYYNPSNNEIVLPAAIFSIPGNRDADVDDAVIYGYAGGGTIGHEITHGFDDEGRRFDEVGNLTDWWTVDDAAKFQRQAAAMVKQFEAYEPLPGLHINGSASLGENLADYGGVLLGLEAFKKTEQFKKGELIAGLTPLQRYFLGYALGWLNHQQEARLRLNLLADVHAPAKWRVLGPLSNIPEFYEAFGVKPGQPMWRPEAARVHVW